MDALGDLQAAMAELRAVKAKLAEIEACCERAYLRFDHALAYWTAQAGSPPREFSSRELHDLSLGPHLTRVRDVMAPAPGEKPNELFYLVLDRLGVDVARELIRQRDWSGLPALDLWARLRDEAAEMDAAEAQARDPEADAT